MLQAWLDDSGRGQKPVFVLAGYFSSMDFWRDFSDEWKSLLGKSPSLKHIKGKEAFGLRGEFKGWSETDRDARLLEFVALIQRYSNYGIGLVVEQTAFEQIIKVAPSTPFSNPQTLAHFLALISILSLVRHAFGSSEQIDIVFDRDLVHRRAAERAYKQLFKRDPALAALLARPEPRFEDDDKFVPLQAADLLAHCMRAYYDPEPKYERVRNSPVLAALRAMKVAVVPVRTGQMQYWRDRVEKGVARRIVAAPDRW